MPIPALTLRRLAILATATAMALLAFPSATARAAASEVPANCEVIDFSGLGTAECVTTDLPTAGWVAFIDC
jgi:hypothetical protein